MVLNERCQKLVKERIEHFGLPKWVATSCPSCRKPIGASSIIEIQVHFEPMFLGDVSFSYHCRICNSLFIMHAKCDVKNVSDLVDVMSGEKVYELQNRDELLRIGYHNILVAMVNEASDDSNHSGK